MLPVGMNKALTEGIAVNHAIRSFRLSIFNEVG